MSKIWGFKTVQVLNANREKRSLKMANSTDAKIFLISFSQDWILKRITVKQYNTVSSIFTNKVYGRRTDS